MMPLSSSALAIALLERLVSDSEALAGDLLEQFEHRRSHVWLWAQVVATVAIALLHRTDDIRPLKLVDLQPVDAVERSRRLSLQRMEVNLTASPLHGAGGLTLVLLAVLLTQLASELWWVLLASMVAGIVLGVVLIARRRTRMSQQPPLVFEGLVSRYASTIAILLWIGVLTSAAAQTPTSVSRPSFDVTSVKTNPTGVRSGAIQPGRFAQSAVTLRQLVRLAYGTNQIVGGPGWIDSERFDVEGRGSFDLSGFLPGRDGSPPQVYLMLQQLLADRFTLVLHRATQERPVYALVTSRRDREVRPRLARSTFDCEALLAAAVQAGRPPAPPSQGAMPRCAVGGTPGHLMADSIDMTRLASVLSESTDRVVIDRTDLAGRFNVELQWTPDPLGPASSPNVGPATDAPPALVTAIQEQLGLKLDPITAPIEVLVIDSADRPTPN